jgi:hypothetical protein
LCDEGRTRLRDQLLRIASGTAKDFQFQCSLPDGRPWFELFTSGVDFGSWWKVEVEQSSQVSLGSGSVRFIHSTVQLQLMEQSAATLAEELMQPPVGGVCSSLALQRKVRPSAEPQAIWLWHWPAGRSAG